MKKTLAIVISLLVCLMHTSGLGYAMFDGNAILETRNSQLETSSCGNYSDNVTALGTGMAIGAGLTGYDLPLDARDLYHDVTHWETTWGHVGQTALDAVGLLPLVGVVKNLDEVAALFKGAGRHSDDAAALVDLAKQAKRTGVSPEDAQTLLRWADEYNVVPALDHTVPPLHWQGPHIRIGPVNHIIVTP